ncbi:hypothetical protein F2Q68_00006097 [Brassica cretica]|uniref:RING-type E3 ubiquitin transferase n=1 Tax=Brassica cretica TaxID=69181 RepID=A0A8S9J559_BRACR|nr:hypothetical protein F2Q68_00006097 [Brassica cretica]
MKIFPEIEAARPGSSTAIQTLNKALEKAKLLLQYCSESSKLYMAVTGDAILSRGSRSKKLLEQSLADIRTMVPTALAIQILEVLPDLKSTELSLESSEEDAGKDIRELIKRSTSSSVSSDEIRDFHFAALKLQLSTPETIVIERRSLKSLFAESGECKENKRQILKYLLCLLKKHEKIIWSDHKESSLRQHPSVNDSVSASVAEAGCSEEHNNEEHNNDTLPEQFKCPLSLTVMYDPVIISSGHTFERMSIQRWFDLGNDTCPVSKRVLDDFTLQSNVAMKDQISKWCKKHGLDVQDPAMNVSHNLDFSIASFTSSLYNIPDLSCFTSRDFSSSFSTDSPSYSRISRGGYFMPMQTIASESGTEVTDSTHHSEVEIEPLCELSKLPWDAQVKVVQDVRSLFEKDSRAVRSVSPSRFLEPLITFLKNAHERNGTEGDVVKCGLDLLLTFLSGNRKAIESLKEDLFEMLCVFLGSELVAEEALNVLEVLSNHPQSLSKITSTSSLSSLLKIAESGAQHLQEQAMITLKNLSATNEICAEMVSLGFVHKLTSFLQQNVFSKHSIIMLKNLCNTEKALKKLVDRVMKIFPEIEAARPGSSTAIQTLNKALEKAKLLLQYCSESSKLYMAVTGDAILSRGSRSKKLLEQSLADIRTMVPTALAIQILEVLQDLKSTELSLESSEEEAGKAIRELMRRSTSSSVSSDEIRYFHFAALKLQLSTPEAVVVERRSLKSLYGKLGECEGNKRQILKYLLCLLKKHEKIIWSDHKDNSLTLHQFSNDSVCAGVAEAGCSEEYNATLPEQFKCPLSLTVMYDPVIISSGHTFERMWIQKWFDECNDSCPVSKRIMDDFTLQSNVAMKDQISKWCSKNGLDVQDPAMKHVNAPHNLDFSIASFTSSVYNIPDLSCFTSSDISSSFSTDSPSYSKMSMQTIASESETEITDSTHSELEIEPLCELSKLPWNAQVKVVQDVRSLFERDSKTVRSMSPSKFIEPLITFLKNARERNGTDVVKDGLVLLLTLLSRNRRAIDSLGEEVFEMLCVFLGSELVAEETLNVLEVLSNHPHSLWKITSTGSLSCLLKIAESGAENLQEQAMITLKKLSSSNEICLEMASLDFVQKLTSFLQQNVFSKHSIIILNYLCNTEKGRVCITETPGCLTSIAELLDSNVPEEVENAISILLQLCVEKIEYCYLEGLNIYSSLLLISNNGTEEAKVGASELLRALAEVEEEESSTPGGATTSLVVTPVTQQEPITTPSPKNSGLFGLSFPISKKKKKIKL